MLDPWSAVEIEVLVDLALAAPRRRFVDGELDGPRIVGHHDAHQGAVLGRDVLVFEGQEPLEAEHALIPFRPVVHAAEFHVAHDVVDPQQAEVFTGPRSLDEAGQERPVVRVVRDERVDGVAVRPDRRMANRAVVIGQSAGFDRDRRAPADGLGERQVGIVDVEGDVAHAIAVALAGVRRPDDRARAASTSRSGCVPGPGHTRPARAGPFRVRRTRAARSQTPGDRRTPPASHCPPRTPRDGCCGAEGGSVAWKTSDLYHRTVVAGGQGTCRFRTTGPPGYDSACRGTGPRQTCRWPNSSSP